MNVIFRLFVVTLIAVVTGQAQSSAWLRMGGPESRKIVADASNSTPVVISSPAHGFQTGDVVWVSFVHGNTAANGARKVKSVSENSFAITDLQDRDITANGAAFDFNPTKFPGIKGYVGKAQNSLITEAPGMLLDGPMGQLTAQVRDPDGPGGGKAPKANAGWAPYAGMQRRLGQFISNPQKVTTMEAVTSGAIPYLAALDWYMDNSRQQSLQAARYWVNNVEKFLSVATFTACNESYKHCGRGSFPDWMSFTSANMVYAYSLIRSELSPAERKAFADKMLNDQSEEETCTNTLHSATGTVSIASGSKTVAGLGTKFLSQYGPLPSGNRRWINLSTTVGYPSWAQVESVQSDTQLTLTAVLSASNSYQDIAHGYVEDWTTGSCGVKWYVSHHGSSPNVVTKRLASRLTGAVAATDQKIVVNAPANFPSKAPFAVRISSSRGEVGIVTAVQGNTFTVTRGAYGTSPSPAAAGTMITLQTHPGSGGIDFLNSQGFAPLDAPRHNLTIAKVYGYITLGMGLANDDPRAVEMLQDSWNYYYDFQYPDAKAMWTGITQGGYAYGPNRWMDFTFRIVATMKNSIQPAIDITDGDWLKSLLIYPVYISLPHRSTFSVRYADSGTDESIIPRWVKHVLMGNWLYPNSIEASSANYWYRSLAKFYDANRWYDADSHNSLPYALIFSNETDPSADFRKTIPPYFFFTKADTNPSWNQGARYNAVVSRQNWEPDSTYLWSTAFSQPGDHLGSYPGPGTYKIIKNQYLIGESGPGTQGSGSPINSNSVQIGASSNLRTYNYELGQMVKVDRQFGSDPYVYFRVNSIDSYKKTAKLNYIYRHFVHLKTGPQDYVIVYDDADTTGPVEKFSRLHYYSDNGETPEFRYEGDLITFKRDQAMISTRVLLPVNAKTENALSSRNPTAKELVHSVVLNGGTATGGEFLVVHRPSTDRNDRMPEVQNIDAGASFRGALIHDQIPKVVLFARGGSAVSQSVTFTIPGSSSVNDVVLTGLSAGSYTVTANGTSVVSNQSVGSHGSIYFKSAAGVVNVVRVGVAQLEVTQERPQIAWAGSSLFFRFAASGGQEPYQWTVKGSLPAGLELKPDGTLSGVPEKSGIFSFIVQLFDSSGASTEFPVDLEVVGAGQSAPLSISSLLTPRISVIGTPYSFQLEANGGTRPYKWDLTSGTLPMGLSLDQEGLLSGTPATPGEFQISVQVTDSSGQSASSEVNMEVRSVGDKPTDASEIAITEIQDGHVGTEFSISLQELSEVQIPYGWTLNHGEVPNGLYLDSSGRLSGIPVRPGVFTFSARIVRQAGPIERFYVMKINDFND